MIKQDDKLILATGNGGKVYSISMDGDELIPLADTEAKQVTALAIGPKKQIILGTANKGSVARIGSLLAKSGTITSLPIDASQVAKWGTINALAHIPPGAKLLMSTRTGNLAEPNDNTWSKWSAEIPAVSGKFIAIPSPAGRFCQYRFTLKAGAVLKRVELIHQVGNLPPILTGITASASAGPEGAAKSMVFRSISIQASDLNGDSLIHEVQFRQIGTKLWIKLAEKLATPQLLWDTREVGDGVYELRVTTSDSPSNPPKIARKATRISEPITVDNTSPIVKALQASQAGKTITVGGQVTDSASRISTISYSVDSQGQWTTILPVDGICDSDAEAINFEITKLKPGAHRIAVKAIDILGNVGYASVYIVVE